MMHSSLVNRITQGQFSFLPDLTDEQVLAQIEHALKNSWAINAEYTDDPHPHNTYWEMFGSPMFDLQDPAGGMMEIMDYRKTFPNHYIRVAAFDNTHGWETPRILFIANRPKEEPGLMIERQEVNGHDLRHTTRSYVTDKPEGERY